MSRRILSLVLCLPAVVLVIRVTVLGVAGELPELWGSLNIFSKLSVLMLYMSGYPAGRGIWVLAKSGPPAHARALRNVSVLAAALVAAFVLQVLGWYGAMDGVDAAGQGWFDVWHDTRRLQASITYFAIIPTVGIAAWLFAWRSRRAA